MIRLRISQVLGIQILASLAKTILMIPICQLDSKLLIVCLEIYLLDHKTFLIMCNNLHLNMFILITLKELDPDKQDMDVREQSMEVWDGLLNIVFNNVLVAWNVKLFITIISLVMNGVFYQILHLKIVQIFLMKCTMLIVSKYHP